MVDCSFVFCRGLEVAEPLADESQPPALEAIDAHAAVAFVGEQTGGLKNLQMAGGGLPGVRKTGSDFACGHSAAIEEDGEQDVATRGMGECRKDGFVGVALVGWGGNPGHRSFSRTAK
jgi:hypothetical protein